VFKKQIIVSDHTNKLIFDMDWYKGKRVVITGATSGIGELLLRKLEARGAFIMAVGRKIDKIKETGHVFPYQCDVSKKENMDALFEYAYSKLGGVDIFFANAGFGYYEKIRSADWDHIDNIYKTNVYAPIYGLEKMIQMMGTEKFSYVITASGVAQTPLAGFSLYTSTKFAIDGFSQAMHLELSPNVSLTTVYPVAMKTDFFGRSGEGANLPIFQQRPEKVVDKIIKGVEKRRKYIRPLPIFNLTVWFMRVFPFIGNIGLKWSARGFHKWVKNN